MHGLQKDKADVSLKCESVWFKTKLVSQFLSLSFLLTQPFFLSYLHAAPVGGEVVGGTGSISQSELTTTINQSTQNLAVNWQSFDINTNEKVNFIQPNSSSIALNRILGNNGSTIQGQINANGQVILVNPNGVFFTPTATINVGGLVASSLDMTPSDFMNGNYIFNEVLGTEGTVINSGIINASTGGNVALIGKQVKNEGLISANLGSVVLAAGKQSILTFDNQGLLGVKVTKEVLQDEIGVEEAVINSGEIKASGGRVLLTASTSQDVFSKAVNTNQLEQAKSVVVHDDGTFTLGGGADVLNSGSIDVSSETQSNNSARIVLLGENITSNGQILADVVDGQAGEIEIHAKDKALLTENSITSAQALSSGQGGFIKILGDKVGLFDTAQVNASGANGGGEVLIGGDRRGLNSNIRNASFIYLGDMTTVNADATVNGDGGKIITFASDTARIHGELYARGGINSGDGGFIETSGLRGFEITNAPDVRAFNGNGGLWLIDPYNITIVNDAAAIPTSTNINESTSGGTDAFTSNGDSAVLEIGLIEQSLLNQNVEITTGTGATSEFGDISFQADLVFDINGGAGGSTKTLTLNADRDITFTNTSSITSTTNDSLNLTLKAGRNISISSDTADANGFNGINLQDGNFTLDGAGLITFNAGTLDTGGGSIDIQSSSSVAFNGGSISTNGGIFQLSTTGNITSASSATNSITTSGGDFIVNDAVGFDSSFVDINVGFGGDINLDGAGTGVTGNVVLGNLTATSNSASDLFITNATNITQASGTSIYIGNITDLNVNSGTGLHSIVLENSGNNFRQMKIQATEAKINDSNNIYILGGTNVTSLLEVTSAGNIEDLGNIIVSNTNNNAIAIFDATKIAEPYGDVILNNDNNFNNVKIVNANDVTLNDVNSGLAFEANNGADSGGVLGNLSITSTGAGNIIDMGNVTGFTGEINVAGTSQFTVANGSSIYLDVANNTFGGNVTFLGYDSGSPQISNISIVDNDTTGLILENTAVTGDLDVTAGEITFNRVYANNLTATTNIAGATGNINQNDYVRINNLTSLETLGNIELTNVENDFSQVVIPNAIDTTLADRTGIQLGKITMSGDLSVISDANNTGSSVQNITQIVTTNEGITVGGTSTFNAGDYDVILTNNDNDFDSTNSGTGAVYISARRAEITDSNALVLGDINLTASSNDTVSIFISGAVSAGGITQLSNTSIYNDSRSGTITRFDSNGSSITLDNLNAATNNDFRIIEIFNASSASITDTDEITLGDAGITGDLTVNSGLGGSQAGIFDTTSAQVNVGGTSTFTSRSGTTNRNIVLDSSNSNYNIVNILNAADVDITDNTDSVGIQGTVTGDLTLTANGTSASNVINNPGTLIVSGNAEFIANDNQSIDLSNSNNSFTNDPDFTAVSGRLNNISITDITDLQLQNGLDIRGDLTANASSVMFQNTSIGGNLNTTANSTINQSGGRTITVAGVSTLNGTSIDFTNSGNDFQSDVTVTNTNATVSLRDDTGGISLGSTANAFTSADLNVESNGGNITQNNSITTGIAIFDSGSSDVLLNTNSSNDFTAGVTISSARDAYISDMNALNIANSNTSRDLDLTSLGTLSFGSTATSNINVGRNLTFSADGAVSQVDGSTLTVTGNSLMAATNGTNDFNITLNSSNNDFNTVSIQNAASVNLRDSTGYIDISGNVSGNLTVRADDTFFSGNIIRNSAGLSVTGNSTFTALAGKSMDLGNSSNVFTGTVNFTNSLENLNLYDNSALTLQNNLLVNNDFTVTADSLNFNYTTVNGNLVATTTTGLMSQSLITGIQVVGTADLYGGSGGINLRGLNDFNGAVSLQTTSADTVNNPSNVIINDVLNGFELGASNIQGGLSVTANSISQSGGVTVSNASSFVAAAGSDISLMHAANNFNAISFSASSGVLQNVAINNSADLTLASINVTNNLTASSDGDIFNNGQLIVGGLTTVNANNITLAVLSNDFNNLTVTGNNISVTDANNINFSGDSTIAGNLTVNAGTNISDDNNSQILATSGISSFNVGNNASNTIILDSPRHDFSEVRVVAGGDVIISDINGLDMGVSTVSSNLYLVADSDNDQGISNITNNGGAITVSGFTDITTSSGSSVSLIDSANDFGDYLTFNETGVNPLASIEISNTNNTLLDNVNATNLTVTSTGSVSQDISQTTTSLLLLSNNATFDSGTADVNLNNQTNDFSNISVSNANNVTVTDTNSITVGSINATGTVTINSNGMTLGTISANTVSLNSGTSSISDGNGGAVNITSNGSVSLTATNGIGNGNPLDLGMNGDAAKLSAFNSGSGNIEFTNTGNITLEEVKNTVSGGTLFLENNGTVTIKSVIIDKTNSNSVAYFDVRGGNVLGEYPLVEDSNGNIVHLTANSAIFQMNGTGTVGVIGSPLITDIPNIIELIDESSDPYIQFYGGVPPNDFIGNNAYKNRALQSIESLSGQQLIEVESLSEIDPAIFTDVRNYSHSDIALMMPSDQRYDVSDEEEEDEEAKEKRNQLLHSSN